MRGTVQYVRIKITAAKNHNHENNENNGVWLFFTCCLDSKRFVYIITLDSLLLLKDNPSFNDV